MSSSSFHFGRNQRLHQGRLCPRKKSPRNFRIFKSASQNWVVCQATLDRLNQRVVERGTVQFKVIKLGSDTFSNPIFQKGLENQPSSPIISVLGCLALPPRQKFGLILVIKFFLNLKLSKNHLNKKCAPNILFFNEKRIQFRMIFDIENSL